MASKNSRRFWTSREGELALFLYRTPATAQQIFAVSQTWAQPFASLNVTYRRLRDLIQAGWVFRSPLAIASQVAARDYYQLTLDGYRLWRGDPKLPPPTKRFFTPTADALHQHLFAKAQFLTHLTVVAYARGFRIENDKPENTFEIRVGEQSIRPDHYLELVGPYGRRFRRFFEFDRSTESQVSGSRLQNTWRQKNLVYDAYQNQLGRLARFRVVPVTTESRRRLENILQCFTEQSSNPNRQLYVGVYLEDFLAEDDALCHPIFANQRRLHVPLIPTSAISLPPLGGGEMRSDRRKPICNRNSRQKQSHQPIVIRSQTRPLYDPMPALRSIGWESRAAFLPMLQVIRCIKEASICEVETPVGCIAHHQVLCQKKPAISLTSR